VVRNASDSREAEVGNVGPPVLVDQYVRLRNRWSGSKYGGISFEKKKNETYPFQISVDHAEVVHILQAICNTGQLNSASVVPLRDQATTYKFGAVDMSIPLDELVDVTILHPLGYESKPVFV